MKKKLSLFLILISVGLLTALAAGPAFAGNHGEGGAVPLREDGVEKAKRVQEKHTNALMARQNVEGTGVGLNANGQAVVVIFTARPDVPGLPDQLDGVSVVTRVTGKFYALAPSVAPPPLDAEFTWNCSSLICDLDASTTTGRGGKTYSWDFGDTMTGSGEIVSHTYEAYSTYTVMLTVTNDRGELSAEEKLVTTSGDGGGGGDPDCYATGETMVRCARPVPIGVSTGHPAITAGTIGARVISGGSVYALSNNHVYANQNDATLGDAVIQPGSVDGGTSADDIGTLDAFEPIKFDGTNNTMDAAIALSSTDNLGNATPSDGYGTPSSSIVSAYLGQAVQKHGRTTNWTTGTVSEINVTVNVCYEVDFPWCTKMAKFVDQIAIEGGDFSAGETPGL